MNNNGFLVTITAIGLFLISGCATSYMKGATAAQIGCPEEEIRIYDEQRGFVSFTWKAECRGHKFLCSNAGGATLGLARAFCHKELQVPNSK